MKTAMALFSVVIGKPIRAALIAGIIWTFGLANVLGRDVLEVESRYRGDGWFDYRLRTLEDPFFKAISFHQFLPDPFTNYVANTLPNHWTNFLYDGKWTGIMFDETVPQPRINEISFSVQSSSTHFRRSNYGFRTSIYLQFVDFYLRGGIGGYVNLACLVPCAPEEADGSPDVMISRVEMLPDVTIDQLILTNGNVHGLIFSWDEESTVELQATHNLTLWTTVARLWGNPPQTTWTTNLPLNSFGKYFRLSVVANSHLPNDQAASALASKSHPSREIPMENVQLIGDQIQIGFDSVPNARYEVDYCEWAGRTFATKQIVASETYTTLFFQIYEPRNAACFKVRQLSD